MLDISKHIIELGSTRTICCPNKSEKTFRMHLHCILLPKKVLNKLSDVLVCSNSIFLTLIKFIENMLTSTILNKCIIKAYFIDRINETNLLLSKLMDSSITLVNIREV